MSVKLSMVWIVAGLALHFTFAFLAGVRWERGQAAKRENAALTHQVNDARAAAKELHEMAVSIQAEHIASIERLNVIAHDFEVSREQQQQQFTRQRVALSALLAKRPDLDLPAGADILRHWQASNAGTGLDAADAASATDSGGIDAAVSDITDAGQRSLGEFDCEPRCCHGALPPVPDDAPAPDRGDEDVGNDGAAELLHGAHTRGDSGGAVR